MKTRHIALAVVLAGLGGVWSANALHVGALERSLDDAAQQKLNTFTATGTGEVAPLRFGHEVVVSKSYLLLGTITGKVSLYLEHEGKSGDTLIEGFEFFFARDNDSWQQTESGRCVSEECTLRGLALLKQLDAKR